MVVVVDSVVLVVLVMVVGVVASVVVDVVGWPVWRTKDRSVF